MASIGRWRRADPGSVPDLGLRPGLVRISRSKAGRRISDRIGWTAAASADPRTRPTRGDDASARSPTRAAERPVPLGLVLPLPPPLDQRRDASPREPEHQHDDWGRRDEQVCERHSGLDDTAAQMPCR